MATVELVMPKMGESIMEATILKWVKKEGDTVAMDETILEIATDKVDSEIPSPVEGTIQKILYKEDDVVEVGEVIALIATEGDEGEAPGEAESTGATAGSGNGHDPSEETPEKDIPQREQPVKPEKQERPVVAVSDVTRISEQTGRFYSPLVRNIAKEEGISMQELDRIEGSGLNGRVTKRDILGYIEKRKTVPAPEKDEPTKKVERKEVPARVAPEIGADQHTEIIEMDRLRKLIADHMVMSKQTAPHVTSFVEADVTPIVEWRNKVKGAFQEKYGEKITYTPIFIQAITKAIRDFPMINISVEGTTIIRKKDIHIGMAAALPSGNLIVPVIRNADTLNLVGLTKAVNDLAGRSRTNQLKPEEIQGGTFTLTNVGTFGNVMGTPIINQPQVAIMAAGAIRKKPAVVETQYGDLIAVRQLMFLSLSYDHRVVDGLLGGSFLRRVADYLEDFDATQEV